MNLVTRLLSISAEAVRSRLSHLPGAFWFMDGEGGRAFGGAFPADESHELDPEPGLATDASAADLPRWVGLLPYEAMRGLERPLRADLRPAPLLSQPLWRRFGAVVVVQDSDSSVEVRGDDPVAVERLAAALHRAPPSCVAVASLRWAEPPERAAAHEGRIGEALRLIADGELYQVNLARRFRFLATGHPIELLRALGPLARAPYAAALDFGELQVVSASPELFLDLRPNGRVATRPIKGTRPRHPEPQVDAALAQELDQSEKEAAELSMVVDIERNDLGRIALPGSVILREPPHVVSHPTVHHREALIEAQLRRGVSRAELLSSTCPSGSVTGAPKVRAMELIAQLEPHRRGLYTGALGYLGHDGGLRLSMAIRVLVSSAGEAHYFAGGGIVADSEPAAEVKETLWKAEQLRALVGAEHLR